MHCGAFQNIKTGFNPLTCRKRGQIFKIMAPDCCWIICMSCLLLPEIKSKSLETREPLFFLFFCFFNVTETLLNASFDFPTFDWFFINCWIWRPQQTSESICKFIFGPHFSISKQLQSNFFNLKTVKFLLWFNVIYMLELKNTEQRFRISACQFT